MKGTLKLHPERAKELAEILKRAISGGGIFGVKDLPDDLAEKAKGFLEREEFLSFIMLTTALDYMRNAQKLWESALLTAEDPETRWVFSPEKVVEREDLLESALSKHGLALRKKRDTEIWLSISKTVADRFGGSIEKMFDNFDFDAVRIFNFFRENKRALPSISGIKIFPHWIRILVEKTQITLKNVKMLPIPVDVHVARASVSTGCISGRYASRGIPETLRKRIIEVWRRGLEGTDTAPLEMFRPLWLLSKHGCSHRSGAERPKLPECPAGRLCAEGSVYVTSSAVDFDVSV